MGAVRNIQRTGVLVFGSSTESGSQAGDMKES